MDRGKTVDHGIAAVGCLLQSQKRIGCKFPQNSLKDSQNAAGLQGSQPEYGFSDFVLKNMQLQENTQE